MNKSIFLVLCCAVLLSCKKDKKAPSPEPQPQSKERQLNFTINGFKQSTGPVTNAVDKKLEVNETTSIENASILTYVLLDSVNQVIKIVNQSSTDAAFGTFTDSVLPGTYYVAFLASEKPGNSTINNTQLTYKNNGRFCYSLVSNTATTAQWRDLLFTKTKIVVTDSNLTLNFTLSRIVGKIELEILDALPAGANGLNLSFTETSSYFSVITGKFVTISGVTIPGGFSTSVVPGTTNNKLITYTGTLNTLIPVTITSYHSPLLGTDETTVIRKAGIRITCQANKVTIISGNLFSNTGIFNITVGDWNPSVTIPF